MRTRTGASFIAADDYGLASELARLVPAGVPVVAAEPRWALFNLPAARLAGAVGILVRSARRGDDPDRGPWTAIGAAGSADRSRDGALVETYRLYRVVGGDAVAPQSPRVLPEP